MTRRAVLASAALIALAGCAAHGRLPRVTARLEQGSASLGLRIEVAATPGARTRGLMGRASVPPGTGMLFLFPEPVSRRSFWMKNTLVPLEIAFVRDRLIVEVRRMEPCPAEPCPLTTSEATADSALELRPGTLAAAGLGAGAHLSILGALPSPT